MISTDEFDHMRARAMRTSDRHGPLYRPQAPRIWTRRPAPNPWPVLLTVAACFVFLAMMVLTTR